MPEHIYRSGEALCSMNAQNGAWVVMTAEIPAEDERGGDIVRVAGMKTPSRMPLLAQHLHVAPDGSPTVIGSVVEFKDGVRPWKGKNVPAKLARFEWADTELARKYKQLWPTHINTVSIGAIVNEAKPMEDGGIEYSKTELFELSVVTVPANPGATALQTIKSILGDALVMDDDPDPVDGSEDDDPVDDGEHIPLKEFTEYLQNIDRGLAEFAAKVYERFDDVESKIVVASEGAGLNHDRNTQPDSIDLAKLRALLNGD